MLPELNLPNYMVQGVQVLYMARGKMGIFKTGLFMAALLQAFVMFTVATGITRFFATVHLKIPGLGSIIRHSTTTVFAKYVYETVDIHDAVASAALKTALQATTFHTALDPDGTNNMSRYLLFKSLQLQLGTPAEEALQRIKGGPEGAPIQEIQDKVGEN